jgi:hypothetical protein
LKIRRPQPALNRQTLGPAESMTTTRSPRAMNEPIYHYICDYMVRFIASIPAYYRTPASKQA